MSCTVLLSSLTTSASANPHLSTMVAAAAARGAQNLVNRVAQPLLRGGTTATSSNSRGTIAARGRGGSERAVSSTSVVTSAVSCPSGGKSVAAPCSLSGVTGTAASHLIRRGRWAGGSPRGCFPSGQRPDDVINLSGRRFYTRRSFAVAAANPNDFQDTTSSASGLGGSGGESVPLGLRKKKGK